MSGMNVTQGLSIDKTIVTGCSGYIALQASRTSNYIWTEEDKQGQSYPKLSFDEAILTAWSKADDGGFTAMIVHTADALESLSTSCVPDAKRKCAAILYCDLLTHR